jgi:tetratricopeptide (TPR) repeat protein
MRNARSLFVGLAVSLSMLAACSGTETRKARYLERGQSYLAEGNLDKARVEFSNALQIDPNDAQSRYFAGQVAEKLGKPRDAVGNYIAAIEADTNLIAARAALGRIYLLGGLPDKAREVIEPGLVLAPDDPQLRTVRGGLRAVTGDLEGAMEDAHAAVKGAPTDEVAVSFLAAQYARQRLFEDAILVLNDGIKNIPATVDLRVILANLLYQTNQKAEALKQLEAVAKAHSDQLVHWQRLAQLHLLEKNQDGAIEALRQAVIGKPDSIEAKSALVSLIGAQKGVPAALAEMQKFVIADPKNAELQLALAQFHEAAREPEKAEATYRGLIKSEGVQAQGLVARDRLAAMLVKRNDFEGAEALIAEVLKENPRDNDALILRAGIGMTRGQIAAAITDLRSVLRDQPNSIPLMRTLARAHLQNGDMALAEEQLRQAVQANPGDVQSRFDLASLLTTTNRGNLALPVLEQLIKDSPDNMQAREAYFRVQIATADPAGARRTAEEIRTLRPDLPLGFMLAGSVLERDGKFAEATAQYESGMKLAADPAEALSVLVRVDLNQKQTARAMGRVQAVLAKSPKHPVANQLLGELQMIQRNTQAALQAFDAAIAAQPAWWVPYRAKANTYLMAKQPEQALATWAEGIAKTGAVELYGDLATTHQQQGNVDKSIAAYEDALKHHPRALPLANNLAMLLVTHRKDKASLDRAVQVAQVLAGNEQPAMLDTLGWVKFQNGAVTEALPLLQKAAEKSPNSAEIRYHLGMAQLRNGDRAAAKLSLESALSGSPTFHGTDDARTALASLRGAG